MKNKFFRHISLFLLINIIFTINVSAGSSLSSSFDSVETPLYSSKTSIYSITFVDTNVVPADAESSEIISVGDYEYTAWYYFNEEQSEKYSGQLYDMYVGYDGYVPLPQDCFNFLSGEPNFKFVNIIDMSKADASNVISMENMFRGLPELSSVIFGDEFDTSNVEDMSYMFMDNPNLTELDLSSFNTNNVTECADMFDKTLTTITIGENWNLNLPDGKWNNGESDILFPGYMYELIPGTYEKRVDNVYWSISEDGTLYLDSTEISDPNELASGYFDSAVPFYSPIDIPWNYNNYYENVVSVVVGNEEHDTITPLHMRYWFATLINLENFQIVNLDSSNVEDMSFMFMAAGSQIENFTLDLTGLNTSNVINMTSMFMYCTTLESIDLSMLNVSSVEIMDNLFNGDISLSEVNFTNWNTQSLTSMSFMFANCENLQTIDLSNFNTENIYSINGLFENCTYLSNINFGNNFDLTGADTLSSMFANCSSLIELDLSGLTTSGVIIMSKMFENCSSLENIIFGSGWDVSDAYDFDKMFYGCESLQELDVSSWDVSNVAFMTSLFENCTSLYELDLSNWNTVNVEDMSYMFKNTPNINYLDLSSFNTKSLNTRNIPLHEMFDSNSYNEIKFGENWFNCPNDIYFELPLGTWLNNDTGHAYEYNNILEPGTYSLLSFDTSWSYVEDTNTLYITKEIVENATDGDYFSTEEVMDEVPWTLYREEIINVVVGDEDHIVYPKNMNRWFEGFTNAVSFNFDYLNTYLVQDMTHLFNGCSSLQNLDLSGFSTYNVVNAGAMFDGAGVGVDEVSGDLEITYGDEWTLLYYGYKYDTIQSTTELVINSKEVVGYTGDLFNSALSSTPWQDSFPYNKSTITSVIIGDEENIVSPVNTSNWFYQFNNLKSIDLTHLDASKTTAMDYMFNGCRSLTTVDLSNLNTPVLESTIGMFAGDTNLDTITFGDGFDTSNVKYMNNMFNNCTNLETLDLTMFDTNNVRDVEEMFAGDINLKHIYVSALWEITDNSKIYNSENMFNNCTNLVGINNTAYNLSKRNGEYARVDAINAPGYLSTIIDIEGYVLNDNYIYIETDSIDPFKANDETNPVISSGFNVSLDNSNKLFIKDNKNRTIKSIDIVQVKIKDYELIDGTIYANSNDVNMNNITVSNGSAIRDGNSIIIQIIKGNLTIDLDSFDLITTYFNNISMDYDESKVITNINPGTTVTNFKKMFNSNAELEIKDYTGKELADTDLVGTGTTLLVKLSPEQKYFIMIKGDANGDGNIGIMDYIRVRNIIMKTATADGIFARAADANSDNEIGIMDYIRIRNIIIGN